MIPASELIQLKNKGGKGKMNIQNVRLQWNERINTTKLTEWESPNCVDGNGGTTGERQL